MCLEHVFLLVACFYIYVFAGTYDTILHMKLGRKIIAVL